MPFVIAPGRNPIVAAAWAGLRAQQKKEAKEPKAETSAVAHPKGPKAKPGKRTPTKEEKSWMDRITRLGCIACLLDGHPGTPGAVHHLIEGNRRLGHLFSICLCDPGHHQGGKAKGVISRHPDKAAFEKKYGTERELLARTQRELKKAKA